MRRVELEEAHDRPAGKVEDFVGEGPTVGRLLRMTQPIYVSLSLAAGIVSCKVLLNERKEESMHLLKYKNDAIGPNHSWR